MIDVSLIGLILRYSRLNYLLQFSEFTLPCHNFSFNSLALLRDLDTLVGPVKVLVLLGIELLLETSNDIYLRVKLALKVLLQCTNALLIGSFSSLKIINLSSQCSEISFVEFIGIDLVTISINNSLSDALAHLIEIMDTSILLLHLLMLIVLTLFSLSPMLLVVTEGWCSCSDLDNSPSRGMRPDGRASTKRTISPLLLILNMVSILNGELTSI